MSRDIRPRAPGACIFFTVALAARSSELLVRKIERLRRAVVETKAERLFGIDAWVVMPDHLHAVWTLPEGDRDFSTRWGEIKARFTMSMQRADLRAERRPGFDPASLPTELLVVKSGQFAGLKPGLRQNKRERAIWQRRFWEHHICDEADYVAHLRYCRINTVKHGSAETQVDWPYSSIHREIRLGRVEPECCGAVPDGEYGE